MHKRCFKILLGIVVLAWLVACSSIETRLDAETMTIKASELTKLSTAVESAVRYKNPPAGLDETGLLSFATQNDPQLLQNFADYKVRILVQDRHAIVLVCTADGRQGLLEDAGCTSRFDRYLWNAEPARPCQFTLSVASVCP